MKLVHVALLIGLMPACGGGKDDSGSPGDDSAAETDSGEIHDGDTADTSSAPDTSETGELPSTDEGPPCDGESWGPLDDPATAIHVREDGSDLSDGSAGHALASLEAALRLTRDRGSEQTIFVGPGTYSEALDLFGDVDGDSDDGLRLLGCSSSEVTLEAADGAAPVVRATGVDGLHISGFTLSGGTRALWLWGGTVGEVIDVVVEGSTRSGITVDGPTTQVDLVDVVVSGTVAAEDSSGVLAGYGLTLEDATVLVQNLVVRDSTRVGLLADNVDLTVEGASVEGTVADGDGLLGRGIHIQGQSIPSFTDVRLMGNSDAGLVSIQSYALVLHGIQVDSTSAAAIPDSSELTGDGIVVSQGGASTDPIAVEYLVSDIRDCEVTGSIRAGIVVEDVTAVFEGNVAGETNGVVEGASSIFAQGDAVISGPDVDDGLINAYSADEAFSFNESVITLDLLSSR